MSTDDPQDYNSTLVQDVRTHYGRNSTGYLPFVLTGKMRCREQTRQKHKQLFQKVEKVHTTVYTFDNDTIQELITPFRYTQWYTEADLTNCLGRLKIDTQTKENSIDIDREDQPTQGIMIRAEET